MKLVVELPSGVGRHPRASAFPWFSTDLASNGCGGSSKTVEAISLLLGPGGDDGPSNPWEAPWRPLD